MGRAKPQAAHKADTRAAGWVGLPQAVADSAAYLTLSPLERGVLLEILRRFNGYNNGDIAITYEEIGERLKGANRCRLNNGRIALAVAKLWDHGLIDEPTEQSWAQRRARRYRLTFITSGKAPPYRQATNEYLKWTPAKAKNDGNTSSPRGAPTGDATSPQGQSAGDAQSPSGSEIRSFASEGSAVSGDARSLVISKPYQGREVGEADQLQSPSKKLAPSPVSDNKEAA
ncbi:hypothetical protein SH584_04060 [Sphingomonas sp. LY29]|uniref:hypothetical protein n=1 Tax=Sphingomonas sp. LY29 TaxID=3095341 RepID=UPI002D76A5AE|nr:hypothetical protein [Sphingomonas sp. LY29]WRP26616.1 hypothetical protein SH584_04060 [Sphingomonas sp. LY29]